MPLCPAEFGDRRYLSWNALVRHRYGGRVQKVSVAAGFTCPNRDGTVGRGGCTFCNNAGFTPAYLRGERDLAAQIDAGLGRLERRYPDTRHFIAYFQAYSNTYGDFERLKAAYEAALAHPRIAGLAIGTRPDCLPDPLLDYLATLSRRVIVELELGIESCNDATLARVNRGHDLATTVDAVARAASRGLSVTGHLILGLPGESRESMCAGATQLSRLPLAALKFHQLQIVKGTRLARDYRRDPASVPMLSEDDYLQILADFVEHLSPTIALQRLGSEVPAPLRLAPDWQLPLTTLAQRLTQALTERDSWQGKKWHGECAMASRMTLTQR